MIFKGKKKEDQIAKDYAMLEAIEEGESFTPVTRILSPIEKSKRGCFHCTYSRNIPRNKAIGVDVELKKGERILTCMFDHCPLHELDQYKDYREYLRENEGKLEKALSKALKTKVEALKDGECEEEDEKPVDKRTRWLIGVRRSQGFCIEQMVREFGLKRETIIKEIKNYDRKHDYV